MNCLNCKIDVPPVFYAAISTNKCPACGKKIMSREEYNGIADIKQALQRLAFDDEQLTKIAAALTSKYDFKLKNPDDRKVQKDEAVTDAPEAEASPAEPPLGEREYYASDDPLSDPLPGEGRTTQSEEAELIEASDTGFNLTTEQKSELREFTPRPEVVDFMKTITAGALPPELPAEESHAMSPEAYDRLDRARSLQDNLDTKYRFNRG